MKALLATIAATVHCAVRSAGERLSSFHTRNYGRTREAGLTAVEYTVIAALIVILIVTIFGPQMTALVTGWFSQIPKSS